MPIRVLAKAQRLWSAARSWIGPRLEQLPLLLSVGAFGISGFSFYDQYLHKDVDLWIQVTSIEIEYKGSNEGYFPHFVTVFINKGNVPAVVFAIRSHQVLDPGSTANCVDRPGKEAWAPLKTALMGGPQFTGALVVKPSEPLAANLEFERIVPVGDPIDGGFCLEVGYLTANGTTQQALIWLRAPARLERVTGLSPEPLRLQDRSLAIVGGVRRG